MPRARRVRPPRRRYPLSYDFKGEHVDLVDKTEAELYTELARLTSALLDARRLARFIQRLRHPAARAFCTHVTCLDPRAVASTAEAAAEVCRLNRQFAIGLDLLNMMSNSKIAPLEQLRFHMTYACTHRKRDLQQGWNGTRQDADIHDELPPVEAGA